MGLYGPRRAILALAFALGCAAFLGMCGSNSNPVEPEPDDQPIALTNICESLPFDCRDSGALPCETTADCACLEDYCDGVEGSVVPPDLDLSKVECCAGVCLDFSQTPVETCEQFLDIGITCALTGAPAPECSQASNCEAITGIPGFYTCDIFCCIPRIPERVGEGAPCVDNPFVEPQCDFGMNCEAGACVKICGEDSLGEALPTCDQMSWFGPEASCESFGLGPCEATTGCCGQPPPAGPCDPYPACADVGNDCAGVGLTGDCANPDDCCLPP